MLTQWADYVSCTRLPPQDRLLLLPPASTVFWVQVFPTGRCGTLMVFHHGPLNRRRRDLHICSFQLSFQTAVLKGVRGIFPFVNHFMGQQSCILRLLRFGGKSQPFSTVALFSYHKQAGYQELAFFLWHVWQLITFLVSLNFSCFFEYIVEGLKELKKDKESSYKALFQSLLYAFLFERSSSCQTLSYRFVEWVMITPDHSRTQMSG